MSEPQQKLHLETVALHGGQVPDPTTKSRAVPIYATSSYVFDDSAHAARLFALEEGGNIYTRIMNPTTDVFEKRLALLEGGVGALGVASGQAAITLALLNILGAGDEFVSSNSLYGGTYNLFLHTFSKLGIKTHFVDSSDPENFRRAATPKTKALYAETLGNPKVDALDIEAVAKIADDLKVPLIIDNTLASPYLCRPIEYGAAVVVHSATKFIGGHGTSIGGAIVDSGKFDWAAGNFTGLTDPDPSYHGIRYTEAAGPAAYITKARVQLLRDLGPAVSPFNSFLFLLGLETLHLRMERHSENAQKIAEYLEADPRVNWVNYPGLPSHPTHEIAKKYFHNGYGAIMGFGIKGGVPAATRFIEKLQIFSHLANVGDAKSLVIHPASTTHQQMSAEERLSTGVTDDFVRLSIGLENVEDLIADLDQAMS